MYLMIFIFVEDGRKGSEPELRNNKSRENREVESLLQGTGAFLQLQLQDFGECFRM